MSQRSRLDYAFAVGRVRALEKYLIPQRLFIEAAEADDINDSLKVIHEAGLWPEEIVEARKPEDIDHISHNELGKIERLMSELLESEIVFLLREAERPEKLLTWAQKIGNPFFLSYARHCLDLANIKIFLRFLYAGRGDQEAEKYFFAGGFLEPQTFRPGFGLTWSELHPLLAKTDYGLLWEKALMAIEERNTFVILERETENFLIKFWRQAKQIVFGPEPVLAFAMARRQEIKLVRLIAIGRMLKLPVELIKERLSETYV